MKRLQLFSFTLLLMLMPTIVVASPCNLGKIDEVYGSVKVQRNGLNIGILPGMKMCKSDQFITDKLSVAVLSFVDGSQITIGKDTEFIVEEFEINPDKSNLAVFELLKGAFRMITGAITKSANRCEVKTKFAVLGVRGTDFWGGFGLTPDGLDVVMLSGKGVYVTDMQGETVELTSDGQGTTVFANIPPYSPIKWDEEKVARAVATITP